MNLVIDQLKGVLSDSISKFMKENIKLEDGDIKSIFGDSMDKVLYHDEGFVKELSGKMSDVVMPAYVKELRYLKKVVSGIDVVSKDLRQLQEKMADELKSIKPNPQNVDETIKRVNDAVEQFVTKANEIAKDKIGLREIEGPDETKESDKLEESPFVVSKEEAAANPYGPVGPVGPVGAVGPVGPVANVVLKTPDDVSKAVIDLVRNKISDIINKQQIQRGGATKHKPAKHEPDIEPNVDKFLESDKPPVKIPKRHVQDYTGNISSLLNQIMKKKMSKGGTRKKRK